MLGRHHLALTLLTAAIIIVPYIETFYGVVALLGAAIGSLIPDSDSPDAMIFHSRSSGMNREVNDLVNKYFAPFFPVFGYTTKYLIYKPSAIIYRTLGLDIEEKHRGLMHSVLGLFTSTALTLLYASIILWFLDILDYGFIAVFGVFYIYGYFMHLWEDSLTVSGVNWLHPFSGMKLSGKLRTTTKSKDTRRPDLFSYFLLAVLGTVYTLDLSISSILMTASLGLFMFLCWTGFSLLSGVSLER